jgi:hypothetical protein
MRIAPDGEHVGLSQIRRSAGGIPTGIGIVGRLVRGTGSYRVEDARVVAVDGELKGFTPTGRGVTFARFLGAFEAGNPDDVAINLRHGRERRLTTALDWEEDVDLSPRRYQGRRWMVVGSARGTGLLETVSQVRRPTFIEQGIRALPFAVYTNNIPAIAEPWLVDEHDTLGGSLGQPLGALDQGWDARPTTRWKPDGTALLFWQKRLTGDQTSVVIARLTSRRPKPPEPVNPTPTPSWAPPLAGYVPPDRTLPAIQHGKVSGDLRIKQGPSGRSDYQSVIEVTYVHYADQPGFVVDGVERAYYDQPGLYGGRSLYSAMLGVSGDHHGYLKALNVAIDTGSIQGTIESEVDGHHLSLGS